MHDRNKSTITKRIMAIAKKKQVFTLDDLIHAHFGKHHSEAWGERLNSLVSRGKLYVNGIGFFRSYSLALFKE